MSDGTIGYQGSRLLRLQGPGLWLPAAWFAAYVGTGLIVVALQPAAGPSPWYPPLAVGVALLWNLGVRAWPIVLTGDLIISALQYGATDLSFVVVASVTVLEVLAVVAILRRTSFDPRFARLSDPFKLAVASTAGAMLGATLGAFLIGSLRWLQPDVLSTPRNLAHLWEVWLVGDLTGLITFVPILFLLLGERADTSRPWADLLKDHTGVRVVGPLLTGMLIAAITFEPALFQGHPLLDGAQYLTVLPVLWAAVTLSPLGTLVVALAIDVAALVAFLPHLDSTTAGALTLVPLQMLMTTISFGGLLVAVVVRSQRAARRAVRSVIDASPVAIMALDTTRRVRSWNSASEQLFGWKASEVIGQELEIVPPEESTSFYERQRRVLSGERIVAQEVSYVARDGRRITAHLHASPTRDPQGRITGAVAIVEDVTGLREATRERDELATAIGQASEGVLVTDASGAITYVNPAIEATSGYGRHELLGHNPRIFKSGVQPPAFYDELWGTLLSGRVWSGLLVNRRKDGRLYEEATTISPVRSAEGGIVGYVGVKRDLTRERGLEQRIAREAQERLAIATSMARLTTGAGAEETATQVVSHVSQQLGYEYVAIIHFTVDGAAEPLAAIVPPGFPFRVGMPVPAAWAQHLQTKASEGPWVERWEEASYASSDPADVISAWGLKVGVFAPIWWQDQLVGVLACGSMLEDGQSRASDRVPAVTEVATYAGALLGPQLGDRDAAEKARSRIAAIIERRAFKTFYQPIIDLNSSAVVGYEALTRFSGNRQTERVFADARIAGLQSDLDLACIRVATRLASQLPTDAWLSVNVSPQTILTGALRDAVLEARRAIVLEVTEHDPIADYRELVAAVRHMDPPVRISIDDAGAGYASLRHVVELHSDFVKLDARLIRGIDSDKVREAMVAGIVHYGSQTGATIVGEGVETSAEHQTLLRVGVPLGQGYLYGRPGPIAGDSQA